MASGDPTIDISLGPPSDVGQQGRVVPSPDFPKRDEGRQQSAEDKQAESLGVIAQVMSALLGKRGGAGQQTPQAESPTERKDYQTARYVSPAMDRPAGGGGGEERPRRETVEEKSEKVQRAGSYVRGRPERDIAGVLPGAGGRVGRAAEATAAILGAGRGVSSIIGAGAGGFALPVGYAASPYVQSFFGGIGAIREQFVQGNVQRFMGNLATGVEPQGIAEEIQRLFVPGNANPQNLLEESRLGGLSQVDKEFMASGRGQGVDVTETERRLQHLQEWLRSLEQMPADATGVDDTARVREQVQKAQSDLMDARRRRDLETAIRQRETLQARTIRGAQLEGVEGEIGGLQEAAALREAQRQMPRPPDPEADIMDDVDIQLLPSEFDKYGALSLLPAALRARGREPTVPGSIPQSLTRYHQKAGQGGRPKRLQDRDVFINQSQDQGFNDFLNEGNPGWAFPGHAMVPDEVEGGMQGLIDSDNLMREFGSMDNLRQEFFVSPSQVVQ